jgi:DNA-binding FrmR family transcriptional regulator
MDENVRGQVLKRLNYISGHLRGIQKMTKDDRYCVDILRQSYAVRKSLEKLEAIMLGAHLRTCVVEGISTGAGSQVVEELLDLYTQANR